MVDTVYRMASSPYLFPGQSPEEREPIQPFSAFATGANEMSTLDMAAGLQSIANEGVHQQPYYVDYIDDAFGNRIYTHFDPGVEVLDRQVALTTIDVLKGVLTERNGETRAGRLRQPAAGDRQDGHPAEQLDGVLRRCHPRVVDSGDGARPRSVYPDAQQHRRVRPRPVSCRSCRRSGWHLSGPDLGRLHGEHRSRAVRVRRTGIAPVHSRGQRHGCTCRATSACTRSSGTRWPPPLPPRYRRRCRPHRMAFVGWLLRPLRRIRRRRSRRS